MPPVTLHVFCHGVTQEPSTQESLSKCEMNKITGKTFDLMPYFFSTALVTMTLGCGIASTFPSDEFLHEERTWEGQTLSRALRKGRL